MRAEVIAAAIGSIMRLVFERWAEAGGEETPFAGMRSARALLTPLFDPDATTVVVGRLTPGGGRGQAGRGHRHAPEVRA
jgi:hypothetical protein